LFYICLNPYINIISQSSLQFLLCYYLFLYLYFIQLTSLWFDPALVGLFITSTLLHLEEYINSLIVSKVFVSSPIKNFQNGSLSPPLYLYCSTWTVERNTKILQIYKSTLNESMCKFLYFLSYHRPYCNTFPNSDCFEIFTQDKTVSLQILRTISARSNGRIGRYDWYCKTRQLVSFTSKPEFHALIYSFRTSWNFS